MWPGSRSQIAQLGDETKRLRGEQSNRARPGQHHRMNRNLLIRRLISRPEQLTFCLC